MAAPVADYTITPILSCMIDDIDWGSQVLRRHAGEKISIPSIIWLVRGNGLTLAVDSGVGDVATARRLTGRPLRSEEEPRAAFARLGVDPGSVSAVVLSHLHWDHSGGLDLFPQADIYVQRSELHWAIAPQPVQEAAYGWRGPDAPLPAWLHSRPRMKIVDGDLDLAPGLRLVHLPGHTPGCMGLCCDTAGGRHMICCDAAPMFENIEDDVPPGTYVDLNDAYRSLAKIRAIADVVLPSHDVRVLDTKIYPRSASG